MWRALQSLAVTALGLGATSAAALACPDCPTARVVRASVFDENFWPHLAQVSAPLAVLCLICALLHRIDRRPARTTEGR